MFIRLHIQSPGFNLQTVLPTEALPELIAFVQKHRVTDPVVLQRGQRRGPDSPRPPGGPGARPNASRAGGGPSQPQGDGASSVTLRPESIAARNSLTNTPAKALFARLGTCTFPEKLLVATGWLEARQSDSLPPHRRDIKRLLVRLGNEPPANPGRDFRTAWNEGWLTEAGDRCLTVTNEGWTKVRSLINLNREG